MKHNRFHGKKHEHAHSEKHEKNAWSEKLKWLDPFTYVDMYVMPTLNPKNNEVLKWIIYLIFAFVFAYAIYFILGAIFATPAPMVIVYSGSMQPNMYRGDVVFVQGTTIENLNVPEIDLSNQNLQGFYVQSFANPVYELNSQKQLQLKELDFSNGQKIVPNNSADIAIYYSDITGEQIIHRAFAKIKGKDGWYLLTKGDNPATNLTFDQDCGQVLFGQPQKGCITLYPIQQKQVVGKALFRIPIIGYTKLVLFDDIPIILFGCRSPYGCTLP